jgi:hypothetical protein
MAMVARRAIAVVSVALVSLTTTDVASAGVDAESGSIGASSENSARGLVAAVGVGLEIGA